MLAPPRYVVELLDPCDTISLADVSELIKLSSCVHAATGMLDLDHKRPNYMKRPSGQVVPTDKNRAVPVRAGVIECEGNVVAGALPDVKIDSGRVLDTTMASPPPCVKGQ